MIDGKRPPPAGSVAVPRTSRLRRVLRSLRPIQGLPVWARYAAATVIVVALFGIRALLGSELGPSPYLLFFPGIIFAALAFDRGSGFYATALSAVLTTRLPANTGTGLVNVGAGIGLALFVIVGVFCAAVIEALRHTVDELGESERRLEHDIIERERAESALAEGEARFRTTFELAAVGVALVGLDGRWLQVNPRLASMLGYTREELLARTFQDITHPDDLARDLAHLRRLLEGEISRYEMEKRYFRKDGSVIWIELAVALVRGPDGGPTHYISVIQEISARKAAEAVLTRDRVELERLVEHRTAALMRAADDQRRAEEALRQGEKLQAVGQLTGGIAHDFNNFLQVIGGGIELLRKEQLAPERRSKILDGMTKAAHNAADLTARLLAFARRQALRPQVFDLNARLDEMVGMLQHSVSSKVTLAMDLADSLWPVRVDPDQLETAILNLVVNARDAMPLGGTVTIATRNTVLAGSDSTGEFVDLMIRDQGEGMPPALLTRVFEPFFTTKGPDRGTGLGLAQVHGFVKQSGGDALIESAPGQGTSVTLRLPRAAEPAAPVRESGAELAQMMVRAAGKRVLIVEDNADVAAFAEAILRELGYSTERAANASEALAALERGTKVDAVFTDVVMPGPLNGLELAARLRETRPDLPVVLASGYSDALAEWQGKRVWEVLAKPYRLDELGAALERALAQREAEKVAG